ncbi:MAG: exodeoxyribonuclease VII small subunit [Bacteroidota bacterium]|nr:exodeoxyribonuclease VII small subunit [Bacteroidota bacterium]
MKKKENDYDAAMQQLEKVVERIQSGEMGLEEMRHEVRAAMELISLCKAKLRNIETDLESMLEEE